MTEGYDATFLPTDVPIPTPRQDVAALTYPRFTVLLDTERALAAVTAVNIDGATLRDVPRTGDWRLDPRVAPQDQAGPDVYARNDLDRGHLVRRRDPGWGSDAEARAATEATFFYPNAAPQAAGFNQSKELWLGLEDHVLEYAEATDQLLSVFTAPVLAADDPVYRGIRVPLRFWKAAAWEGPDGLASTAFVLDQSELVDLSDGLGIVDGLGAFRTFQVPVADIARITGIDFGPLVDADVLAAQGVLQDGWRELEGADDIVW